MLYVANGCRWDPTFDEFVRWSLHYDLWCKMAFFGDDIERANQEQTADTTPVRRRNLLNFLPSVFTMEDALALRRRRGMSERGTRGMVWQWVSRGYIQKKDETHYEVLRERA